MAGICFFFESYDKDVWSGRQINLDAWNYACKSSGDINEIIVVDKTYSKIYLPYLDYKCKIVHNIPDLDGKVIYVCCPWDKIKNSVSLWDFNHNVDWYIFGPSDGWKKEIENGLFIPQSGCASLHSVHIASVVLMHRYYIRNSG